MKKLIHTLMQWGWYGGATVVFVFVLLSYLNPVYMLIALVPAIAALSCAIGELALMIAEGDNG